MDELRKGIAIGMLFGSGSEGHGNLMEKTATENGTYTAAEEIDPETGEIFDPPKDGYSVFTVDLPLDNKYVTIVTSAIESSSGGIFEYDPHDESPELEGYSLFRLDLSGVKTDLEDLKDKLAEYEECCEQVAEAVGVDPPYEPEDVVDAVEELAAEVEECDQCKADVIAKLQEYDPNFDPVTCSDIPPEIDKIVDENSGYEFPEDTPWGKVVELVGSDPVEIDGNDYYFDVRATGYYRSFNPSYPEIIIDEPVFYVATTPPNYDYGACGSIIHVIEKATGDEVTRMQLGPLQGFDAGEYVKLISLSIDYTNKIMNGVYETDDPYPHTPVQVPISADVSRYITTSSPNPRYRVKNS